MAKENKTQYAVLGMLSITTMSGYDMKRYIELSISNFWKESYGQIYPVLKHLVAEGLVSSSIERQEGRPDRHVYTLTDKGWGELRRWLTEAIETQAPRNELLLKLFFGNQVPAIVSLEHVQRYRALQMELLRAYDETEASTKESMGKHPDFPYWMITLNYGRHLAQAMLAWCDETIAALHSLAEAKQTESIPR
jgi:PadR family transcriptional regulator AphA